MNHKRVFGVFPSHKEASIAVEKLLSMGYDAKDISLISKNTEGREIPKEDPTATEAGVKGGTLTGVTVGGVAGLLAGLGVLAIPGIGPLLVAGPIAATLSGVIAGGTLGGTIGLLGGAIVDATVSEEEARYLDERFQAGDVIVYLDVHEDRFEEVLPHLTNAHRDQKRQLEHHVEPSEPLDLPKEPALEEVPQDLPKEAFEPVPKKKETSWSSGRL